jgi:glyoxylase-like metal-dependent hydrolase (beta-lactamase superfamily II)
MILSHENAKKRLTETHDLLGMHFTPAPAAALPTQTFRLSQKIDANGETLTLGYIPPAHTDGDIYVHYLKANVVHMADVFFNGIYPFIDGGTGANINGQIAGAAKIMAMSDSKTKIVPGHGPLGDKAALTKYHDMLVSVRDRVQKQKAAGKKLEEVTASKPTAAFDAAWGKGMFNGDQFVGIVYNTL